MEFLKPAWTTALTCCLGCANGDGREGKTGPERVFLLRLLSVLSFMNLKTLLDVVVCTLIIEEAEIALAAQVVGLCVATRILKHGRQGDDGVEEQLLTDLAQGDVDVALEHQLIRIRAIPQGQSLHVARNIPSCIEKELVAVAFLHLPSQVTQETIGCQTGR